MKPSSSWRPSAQMRERRGKPAAVSATASRPRAGLASSPPTTRTRAPAREEHREADDGKEAVREGVSRGVSCTSSALSTPKSHSRRISPHPSPRSPLARVRRRFLHSPVSSRPRPPMTHTQRSTVLPTDSIEDDGDLEQRLLWLTSHVARVEADNERQKAHIAQLSQRPPPPPAAPSPHQSSAFSHPSSSSAGLMSQWKRRESALLSELDDLRSSLHLSHRQQQNLMDAQDRLHKERQQWESDRAQERAAHDSVVHQLRERVIKERSRRKMLDGELQAMKRLREETTAQRLRLEVEQLQQSQEAEATTDKSQALYERLLTEQRQHEEAISTLRRQLDDTTQAKAEIEGQLKASEDVIASLIPLETEVRLKTAEAEDGRQEVAAYQQQVEALTTQCEQLTHQLTDAHSRLDSAHRHSTARDQDHLHTQQQLRGLEAELKAVREEGVKAREETAVTGEMLVEVEQQRRQQSEQLQAYSAHCRRIQRSLGALTSALRLPLTPHPTPDLDQQADTLRRVEESVAALMVSMAAKEAAVKALEAEVRSGKASLRVQARRAKDVELQLWEEALAQREARHCHHVNRGPAKLSSWMQRLTARRQCRLREEEGAALLTGYDTVVA